MSDIMKALINGVVFYVLGLIPIYYILSFIAAAYIEVGLDPTVALSGIIPYVVMLTIPFFVMGFITKYLD